MNGFDLSDVVARVIKILKDNNMTAKELTEKLSMNKSTVSNWKKKITKPSIESMVAISRIFNVSLDWLLDGREAEIKYMTGVHEISSEFVASTQYERHILKDMQEMNEDEQRQLVHYSGNILYNKRNKKMSSTLKPNQKKEENEEELTPLLKDQAM